MKARVKFYAPDELASSGAGVEGPATPLPPPASMRKKIRIIEVDTSTGGRTSEAGTGHGANRSE